MSAWIGGINMKKTIISRVLIILILLLVFVKIGQVYEKSKNHNSTKIHSKEVVNEDAAPSTAFPLNGDIYNFLNNKANRLKVYNNSIALNNGDTTNTCVYFVCEVLRQMGFNVSNSVCNTSQLISILKSKNLEIITDYKKLKPGDICFTTDSKQNKNGIPSHTYVFMSWVKEGDYSFANICDNQAKDYQGKIYHVRNISNTYTINGKTKDPFSFFVRKG